MAEEGSGRSGGLSGRPSSSGVRGGRLPSIRAPRDLTLGGVRKKTFAPNIPARREKPKESKPEQEKATPHGRQKNEKGRGERGRGRGRGRGEVIQSHSIFEQGPAERLNKGRGSSFSVESADRGPSSSSSSSSGNRSYIKKEKDDPETKRVLDSLLRDDFIESEETVDPEPQLVPVKLPLLDSIKKEFKAEPEEEVKVKKEPVEQDEDHKPSITELDSNCPSVSHVKKLQEPPKTPVELLLHNTKSEDQLVFIQLPDTLPGNPPQEEDDNIRGHHSRQNQPTNKQAEKQKQDEELSNKLDVCHLSDFSEGLIGKLRLHKSGRATLVLGNTKLDVTMGTPAGFLQNVVSIRTNGENGNVINLGNVTHKLVCTPDFDHLLSLR